MTLPNEHINLSDILVSVIMPVFNAENYVCLAIESILNQTHQNFEFLIFDDGSTDQSLEIVQSYTDSRIKIYIAPENVGYVRHLNRGIELAKGKYIARMDADDIALPNRFTEQVVFLEQQPQHGICGTWVEEFGNNYPTNTGIVPLTHEDLIIHQFHSIPFFHPTVMIQAQTLHQHNIRYKEAYLYAEDAEMWLQMAKVTKLANLPKVLLKYRIHPQSVTATKWDSHQLGLMKTGRKLKYESLLDQPLSRIECAFVFEELAIKPQHIYPIYAFFQTLMRKNAEKKLYHPQKFKRFLLKRLSESIDRQRHYSWAYLLVLLTFLYWFPSILVDGRFYGGILNKLKHYGKNVGS